MTEKVRRDFLVVGAFLALVFLPFMGKAYHNDEPFFLAAGEHTLHDPLHPLAFAFTWYGRVLPAAKINTTPPALFYVLAADLGLTGGDEFATRLLLFPLDLLAALSLYLIAARFLKKPLMPTLIAIATPAYFINMNHLMPEKLAGALGFAGLYAFLRADGKQSRWFWASAALLGLAIVSKYNAALFLAAAAAYGWLSGMNRRRLALFCAAAAVPAAALVAYYAVYEPELVNRFLGVATKSQESWWSWTPFRLRSYFAFLGGAGVVTALWPWLLAPRRLPYLVAAAAAAFLFVPWLDLMVAVRAIDRLTGVAMATGGALGFAAAFSKESRAARGWKLWGPWLAAAAVFQYFYWSIMARMTLFLLPPLIFLMAERLEFSWKPAALNRLYAASLALTLAVSAPLAAVDWKYAQAQKGFSLQVARDYLARGRRVWYSGYMGLEQYLGGAGAVGLDAARGGWEAAKPGDAVVVLGINSARVPQKRPVSASYASYKLGCRIPLRLMSGWTGEGGFYSNLTGFLPYSISREPLEEFTVAEIH